MWTCYLLYTKKDQTKIPGTSCSTKIIFVNISTKSKGWQRRGVMLQRHFAATRFRDKKNLYTECTMRPHVAGTHSWGHLAGTKAYHLHSHGNVGGACPREWYVPAKCPPRVNWYFYICVTPPPIWGYFVPATSPIEFNNLNSVQHVAGTKYSRTLSTWDRLDDFVVIAEWDQYALMRRRRFTLRRLLDLKNVFESIAQ